MQSCIKTFENMLWWGTAFMVCGSFQLGMSYLALLSDFKRCQNALAQPLNNITQKEIWCPSDWLFTWTLAGFPLLFCVGMVCGLRESIFDNNSGKHLINSFPAKSTYVSSAFYSIRIKREDMPCGVTLPNRISY